MTLKTKTLEELLKSPDPNFYSHTIKNIKNINITGVTSRSSEVKQGFLFVAKAGATPESKDGHDYIQHAINQGAEAIIVDKSWQSSQLFNIPLIRAHKSKSALAYLCEAFWDAPSSKLKIIGITGTNGKTSTCFMLHSIFKAAGFKPQIIGTLGIGDPGALKPLSHTTMEPEFLSEALAHMHKQNISHVILEASSHGIMLDRISALNFAAVGLTNISHDHLDFHGSMSAYISAKQKLFDELAHEKSFKLLPHSHNFSFERVLTRVINYDPSSKPLGLKLPGDFQINNAALASACAKALDIRPEHIITGLQNCLPIPGRFELIKPKRLHNFQVFIDYAHTPDALAMLLKSARKLCAKNLTIVFGCAGDRDKEKRSVMALIAEEFADKIIITDDNPRSENPQIIRSALKNTLRHSGKQIKEIADRKQAIKTAIINAEAQDIIIIAGKGHEDYQIYGQTKTYFSDREVALNIMENL